MAITQVMLNERSGVMWVTSSRNESRQGQMDKLGKKRIQQQKELFLKKKISKELAQKHTVLFKELFLYVHVKGTMPFLCTYYDLFFM